MSKVVKFGGSSLASAEQFQKVGKIIRADKDRRYVVPSAPGKRFKDDIKVTDMLYGCYDLAEAGKNFQKELKAIKARYQEIIDGLGLDLSLEREFDVVSKQLDFIYQVDGLDDAEPMVFPYELDENSLREDIAIETLSQEDVLKNAKDEAKGMIRLPKVVR